jgi:hypothetical protein
MTLIRDNLISFVNVDLDLNENQTGILGFDKIQELKFSLSSRLDFLLLLQARKNPNGLLEVSFLFLFILRIKLS